MDDPSPVNEAEHNPSWLVLVKELVQTLDIRALQEVREHLADYAEAKEQTAIALATIDGLIREHAQGPWKIADAFYTCTVVGSRKGSVTIR